jgi:pilus assembly protein Flp/PilA
LGKNKSNTILFAPGFVHTAAAIRLSPAKQGARLVNKIALKFLTDESGASAAEYAVLLTLVTVALIGAVTTLGTAISAVFRTVATTPTQNA